MREIKFRAWDTTNKKFTKDIMIDLVGNVYCNDRLNIYSQWREVVNIKLMQSTNLFDKNGKEIFEGDIVKRFEEDEQPGQVIWNDFNCRAWNEKDLEIIGNIYENPELLKNKKND